MPLLPARHRISIDPRRPSDYHFIKGPNTLVHTSVPVSLSRKPRSRNRWSHTDDGDAAPCREREVDGAEQQFMESGPADAARSAADVLNAVVGAWCAEGRSRRLHEPHPKRCW